jgi:diaminohydroxyphosphoribosylaminopyrimidine deaminase/5-amino-6-(5-phosphoribosylamino)uracil reductase
VSHTETIPRAEDEKWMALALDLARRGIGLASPNPVVGCVIVKNGVQVGEGWHEYDKKDHAEVVALAQAAGEALGATAYVTLEPCSHHGRTAPCADALIRAGVSRVVAATVDPNPLVSGRGIEKLRSAGIEVAVGVLEEPARRLNDSFARYIRTSLPLVTLKAAMSLDGRIAPPPRERVFGSPVWLTSEESRREVHRMRHASDALITGINTVLDDDPLLTDRSGLPRRRPLLRVVLDSTLRLSADSALVRSANDDVLVFCAVPPDDRTKALEACGVRVEQIEEQISVGQSGGSPKVSVRQAIQRLDQLQMTSVMIEAGAQINTSAFAEGLVDRVFLFYAAKFLGSDALPLLHGIDSRHEPLTRTQFHRFGPDIAIEGWFRDAWAPETQT